MNVAMLAGSIALVLGGLVAAGAPAASGPAAADSAPVALHFVSWKSDHLEVWDEAIARFTATHPHIRVMSEIGPHSSTAYHDLLTQKLKNHDPTVDLFFMDVVWVPEFASAGWALPLDDRFPQTERAAFIPSTAEAGEYRGRTYGVPSRIDVGLLYYRADLLEKYGFSPPETWEELVRQAAIILTGEAATHPALRGYAGQFKQYEGLVCTMLEFIESRGGRLLPGSLDGQSAALSAPETLAAVRFVRDAIVPRLTSRAALTYQEEESLSTFIRGNALFHRNWPYAWTIANDPTRSTVAGRVGVTRLPRFREGRPAAALGGWLYGINARSHHQEEAWQFIAFLSSEATQRLFASRAGITPSRFALAEDPAVLAAVPSFRDQMATFAVARPRPRTPLYPAVSNILQRYFSRALAFPDLNIEREAAVADRQVARLLALTGSVP